MAMPEERFSELFKRLSANNKDNLLNYMEYLVNKSTSPWDNLPIDDEDLTPDEIQQLNEPREYITGEEGRSEFDLPDNLP